MDYRVDCPMGDLRALSDSVSGFVNVIGPKAGQSGTAAVTLSDGSVLAAQPGVGDTSRVYVAVRSTKAPDFPASCTVSDQTVSEALLGVWA